MARKSRIIGAKELQKRLQLLPRTVTDEMGKAVRTGALEIRDMARHLAPVGDPREQASVGELRASIDAFPTPLDMQGARARTLALAPHGLSWVVKAGGQEAFYARFVEFGTVKMSGRPFFFPSYRLLKARVRRRIARACSTGVKRSKALSGSKG